MKLWQARDAWTAHARCGEDSRYITPPESLTPEDREDTEYGCYRCKVRPECIASAVATEATGVWCASVFIPEVKLEHSRAEAVAVLRDAAAIRDDLAGTLADEFDRRGEF